MRRAFTLVELLVVVTIIAMLVGLLMPALISSRESARIAQCVNNQHQVSLAIMQFDGAKGRLPWSVSPPPNVTNTTPLGWPIVLLPFLGRNDLWADKGGWRGGFVSGTTPTPHIPLFVCPDDTDPSVSCPLSYVVNVGVYNVNPCNTFVQQGFTGAVAIPGPFRDASNATLPQPEAVSLSSVKSPSQTVMLSEKRITLISESGDPPPTQTVPSRQWTVTISEQLGFSWPNYRPEPAPAPQPSDPLTIEQNMPIGLPYVQPPAAVRYWPPLPSIHRGLVVATFCDGHTESLSADTLCQAYRALP
jgi:prepilin-type N-terminal cleavage/methylation domain-containing protein